MDIGNLGFLRANFNEKMATRDAYGEALVQMGRDNPQVVVLDADLCGSTRTQLFAEAFPQRFFEAGIAEANMMGMAAGLAKSGKIPFASSYAVFASGRAFDQIRMAVCYSQSNVKIVATHAGISVGADGASHQGTEDLALMLALPGMAVVVPADGVETKKAIRATAEHVGPVYLRLGRIKVPLLFNADYPFQIGQAVMLRDGREATVIACGLLVAEALRAAGLLAQHGITVRVLNMSTLKPLDKAAVIAAAQETGAIVTAEEHQFHGGLGSTVAQIVAAACPVPMGFVAIKDTFGESGKPLELLAKYGLTTADIVREVERVVLMKRGRITPQQTAE